MTYLQDCIINLHLGIFLFIKIDFQISKYNLMPNAQLIQSFVDF